MVEYLRDKRGLTLIEIIVSITILFMIVAPISSFFLSAVMINTGAEDVMKANNLAQKSLEALMVDESISAETGYVFDHSTTMITDYKLDVTQSGSASDYGVIITLEENNDDELLVYEGSRTNAQAGQLGGMDKIFIEIDSGRQLKIIDQNNKEIATVNLSNNNIRFESYQDKNLKIYVKNEYLDPMLVHSVKALEGGSASTGKIEIESALGELYEITNIYYNPDENETMLQNRIEKIILKISKGSSFQEEDKLTEISVLKRKD